MEDKSVFITHESKDLMFKLRSAVVQEFIHEWIFLHNNADNTYSLEVSSETGSPLSEENHLNVKAFIEKFLIDNDKSAGKKNKKVAKKTEKLRGAAGKTEILA